MFSVERTFSILYKKQRHETPYERDCLCSETEVLKSDVFDSKGDSCVRLGVRDSCQELT